MLLTIKDEDDNSFGTYRPQYSSGDDAYLTNIPPEDFPTKNGIYRLEATIDGVSSLVSKS